jgi:adenylate cyclase
MYHQKPKRSDAIHAQVDALVHEEDRSAEISAGLVRIFAGLALGAVAVVTTATFPHSAQVASSHYRGGTLIVGSFILSGLVAVWLARSRFYRREVAFAFLALDAVLIGLFLHLTFQNTGFTGDFAAVFPVVWLPPLLLTVAVLRIQPNVQVFGLVAFTVVILFVVLAHGSTDPEGQYLIAGRTATFFALQANIMRLAMLLLLGGFLVMAAYRGRRLLVRALGEAERRAALTRFLPAEIASLITEGTFGGLHLGRRQLAAVLFVDIRDSTARAENMDPVEVSIFVASFRQRVTRAASEHGGVVDKFIGDGALVVFGLPEPRPDDAARALACARMLLDLVDRWNLERQFDPAVRVGIGVHVGEVFFGVVGDESRKELTVLGDTVNIGARLEQATKTSGTPLLASAEVVEAAGETSGWTEIRREPLRGRTGIVRVMRPA